MSLKEEFDRVRETLMEVKEESSDSDTKDLQERADVFRDRQRPMQDHHSFLKPFDERNSCAYCGKKYLQREAEVEDTAEVPEWALVFSFLKNGEKIPICPVCRNEVLLAMSNIIISAHKQRAFFFPFACEQVGILFKWVDDPEVTDDGKE